MLEFPSPLYFLAECYRESPNFSWGTPDLTPGNTQPAEPDNSVTGPENVAQLGLWGSSAFRATLSSARVPFVFSVQTQDPP